MQRLGLFVLWLTTTIGVTFLAWQVVFAADAQVSDQPITQAIAVPSTTATTFSVPPLPSTSVPSDPQAGSQPTTSTIPLDPDASTTTPSTTTTVPDETTTTVEPFRTRNVNTSGGTLTVRYRTADVRLIAVNPTPPWTANIEDRTTDSVVVSFTTSSAEIIVDVRWLDDRLVVDIDD